jgi:glutaconate CoA-transferase subunit A
MAGADPTLPRHDMTSAAPQIVTLGALARRVPDGASVALPPDYSGCAMSAVKALIRRGAKGLHLIGVPSGGFQADWLIGAGCVASVEAAAMTLGEYGVPPRFVAAVKAGRLKMMDSTCPAIHAGLQAAEKGTPFIPLRGILGSDLLQHRPDWKVIDNPFSDGRDPIVLIPAIKPDLALFHARAADRHGNVWIGVRRELMLMAHAARRTLVTVERIEDADFLADDAMAAGTIPALYVTATAEAPHGAHPVGLAGVYPPDEAALAAYARAAETEEGFRRWLGATVFDKVLA